LCGPSAKYAIAELDLELSARPSYANPSIVECISQRQECWRCSLNRLQASAKRIIVVE
jgi:hypothetical protein